MAMKRILFTVLCTAVIPFTTSFVDCKYACRECQSSAAHPMTLEVFCTMCAECEEKALEEVKDSQITRSQTNNRILNANQQDDYDGHIVTLDGIYRQSLDAKILDDNDECPTPPVCSDSEETQKPVVLTRKTTTTTTTTTSTTTTTTTTTQKPCPPIKPCIKKKKTTTQAVACMPCFPMCPCPIMPVYQPPIYPSPVLTQTTAPVTETLKETDTERTALNSSTSKVVYLYIGVPKQIMEKI